MNCLVFLLLFIGIHFDSLSLKGRHTKLMIVLLQKSTNQTDDALAGERLSTLASKCDINQKMIFVLPYNDNLMGKFRLDERTFYKIELI